MELKIQDNKLIITKGEKEKGFYASRMAWGDAESRLLYNIKKLLNKPDCIIFPLDHKKQKITWLKKRMWKDGHMVDEQEQYLRSTKPFTFLGKAPVYICLHNIHWAIRGIDTDFNEGEAKLQIDLVPVCKPELNRNKPEAIYEQSKKNMSAIDEQLGINKVKNSYPDGVCPDCGEDIPDFVNEGEECSNCSHVFTEEHLEIKKSQ